MPEKGEVDLTNTWPFLALSLLAETARRLPPDLLGRARGRGEFDDMTRPLQASLRR